MKKLLIFIFLLISCSSNVDSTEIFDTSPTIEVVTNTTILPPSTTTQVSETTTTTTTLNIPDSASYAVAPTISIYNCPEEVVSVQEFEVSWEMFAGSYDIDYFRMSIWKNGDYLSRVFYEKETLPEAFPYPLASTSRPMTVIIINEFEEGDGDTNTYVVYLTVSDSEFPFGEEISCSITFQN